MFSALFRNHLKPWAIKLPAPFIKHESTQIRERNTGHTIPHQNIFVNQKWNKCEQKQAQGSALKNSALHQELGETVSCLLQFLSHRMPKLQHAAAPTVQPKDVLQVGEDFPLVTGAEDALPGDPLVEDVVQDLQRAHMGSLGVEQLWGDRESSHRSAQSCSLSSISLPGPYSRPCCNSMFELFVKFHRLPQTNRSELANPRRGFCRSCSSNLLRFGRSTSIICFPEKQAFLVFFHRTY